MLSNLKFDQSCRKNDKINPEGDSFGSQSEQMTQSNMAQFMPGPEQAKV